jgi:DNA topoisomerase-1
VRAPRTLARIDRLRVPPGWTDVHIAPNERTAVQAWGFDVKGRRQYRYHAQAVEQGELRKYYRVRQLAHDLPTIRARVARDFGGRRLDRRRVIAGVVRLISEGYFRVGSERYAKENKTFGITTLQKRHVHVEAGTAVFTYVGKLSVEQRQVVVDPALVRFVAELERTPGRRLFRYQDADGTWADLSARDVNEYLHALVGVPYTAKDFRTWGGTLRAATILADLGPPASATEARKNVLTAIRLVAAELGNTPAIARKSYIHPMVLSRYLDDGETIVPPRRLRALATDAEAHTVEERALIAFLNKHFPERRRRRDRRRPGRDVVEERRAFR